MRRVQQSGCSRALAKISFTSNTNLGERSLCWTRRWFNSNGRCHHVVITTSSHRLQYGWRKGLKKKDVNAKQSSNFQKHIDTITDALTELTLDGVLRTCPGEKVPWLIMDVFMYLYGSRIFSAGGGRSMDI